MTGRTLNTKLVAAGVVLAAALALGIVLAAALSGLAGHDG